MEQRCELLTSERDAAVRQQSVELVGKEAGEGRLASVRRKWAEAEDEARRWQEEAERAETERVKARGDKARERLEAERKERKAKDDRARRDWLDRVMDQHGGQSATPPLRLERHASGRARLSEYSDGGGSGATSSSEEKQQVHFIRRPS